jgi:GNAT superfamily N-acetyltransferase
LQLLKFSLRKAVAADIPILQLLICESVRVLQKDDYSTSQLKSALQTVYGVDSQLIADGTYFVVETPPENGDASPAGLIVGCGGWSQRKTLYGGDHYTLREDAYLDPEKDAAKIRAFFIKPGFTRLGLGTMILDRCESEARRAKFTRLEMGATLTGVALYEARGYVKLEELSVPLANGEVLPIVKMAKTIRQNPGVT